MIFFKRILVFITVLCVFCDGANILGVFPTFYKSHWNIGVAIMKELAAAGHDITLISPYPFKAPNVRNIVLTDVPEEGKINMFSIESIPKVFSQMYLSTIVIATTNNTLSHPSVQRLMASNIKFDVVIAEIFLMEAIYGLGQHFDCPVIGVSMIGISKWTNEVTGNPTAFSYVPHPFLEFTDKMNFGQRLKNTWFSIVDHIFLTTYHYSKQV